jgi:membrane-bound ClpP family serine protease
MAEQRRTSDLVSEVRGKPVEARGETDQPEIPGVRATDLEPYVGLRYLSKLFRLIAIILLLLLVAEIITGLTTQGSAAIPTLLGEASRLIVLAGALWGVGDLAVLMVDVGHDVRAVRVYMSRFTNTPGGLERDRTGPPPISRSA